MELYGVDANQPIGRLAGLHGVKDTLEAKRSGALNFPKSNQNVQKFNQLLKDSLLDDRVPTAKSLAKKGYTEVTGQIYGLGRWFTDKNGNMINIVEFKNEAGQKSISVNYNQKNGNYHNVTYDADGNPIKGTIINNPKVPGSPVETYEYEYDIEGNPFLTRYKEENLSYPPEN